MGKANVDLEQIKEEWLVGNAVVAFVGALLMAQAWEPSEVKNVIPVLNVTVPTFPQAVVVGFVALLAVSSLVLALASAISPLRSWAIKQASPYSQLLDMLMWIAFLLSLIAALSEVPPDQWWAQALWWGGVALLFFLWGRMVLRPLIPLAKWFGNLLFRLLVRAWNRFVVSRRRPEDSGDNCGE